MIGRRLGRAFQRLVGQSKPKISDDETTPLLKNHADAPAFREYPSMNHHNNSPRPHVTYREV